MANSPEATNDIETIYQQVLGRAADAGGLATWQQQLAQPGESLASVQSGLANSPESQSKVVSLLQVYEGHTPSTSDISAAQTQLAAGLSMADLNNQTLQLTSNPTFFVANGGTLSATAGVDVFEFSTGTFGQSTIVGFDPAHDILQFSRDQFANLGAVFARESSVRGSVQINVDSSHSIVLQGISPENLPPAALRFV